MKAVLQTKRLLLREMDPGDLDALLRVLGDVENMRFYPCAFDAARVRDWIMRNRRRYREDGFGLWALCLRDSGEVIGDCGLTLQNIGGQTLPEIGYHVRRDLQRRGYAREAVAAVRDWAFEHTDFPALYAACMHANTPSIRTAEAVGMRFDREFPDRVNGVTHVSSIRREDWRPPKQGAEAMFDLSGYLDRLIAGCRAAFGERLLYVGLQGSYMREEAREDSDIDVMLILDGMSVRDMDAYRRVLEAAGHSDRACGFICGREEMARWNPLEIRQLRHTTRDLYGTLADYLPNADRADEVNYVKLSLGNLYHELCHRYIHAGPEENAARFRGTCKALFFLIQNLHDLESGCFVVTRAALMARVGEADREMLRMAQLPDGYDFAAAFSAVFEWCQAAFARVERLEQREG